VRLLFATRNAGKLRELRRLTAGLDLAVLSPDDLPARLPEVEEDGATFAENARKKASACARAAGLHALADDSGLCIDALYGLPGVRSARWSEPAEPGLDGLERDRANNRQLLRALDGVPLELRGAEYRAVLALAAPDGEVLATVTGTCRGIIGLEARGEGGFGYDPYFVPEAELPPAGSEGEASPGRSGGPAGLRPGGRTMAELSPEEKDALSHRGDAFRRLRPVLEALAVDESGRRG
jgi:XTP/dITP diphosphohydrolase